MDVKKVVAWSVYDLANTAFSALFVTFFFPMYVKEVLGGTEAQIGLVFGVSMLLVGIVVPVIGAFSDRLHRRIPFVAVFTVLCVIFTSITGFVSLMPALLLGLIANFFYHAALTTYNAILPELSTGKNRGFVSGFGTALGYVGTLLSLGMATIILSWLGWGSVAAIKLMFPATALFFFIFSIPAFVWIRERRARRVRIAQVYDSASAVIMTLRNLSRHKGMISFLLGIFLYINAISAVIIFLFLFSRSEIGLSIQEFMVVYVIFSLSAAVGSFLYGALVDKIGAKNGLLIAGVLWILVVVLLMFKPTYYPFLFAGSLGGIALGAVWTCIRPQLILLSPRKDVGQFFGFAELADKFSGVLGPIVFGLLASNYSYTSALSSLLVFFVVGFVLLLNVPGRR